MPIPKPGQKTIPLKDWRRFLRVSDWFERTVEQGNGTRGPSYGKSLIVKTPEDGIDARSDTTIFSATCIKCVAVETSTPGERTIHETDEELVVYNAEEQDVPGEIFVKTTLSPNGTRYVEGNPNWERRFECKDAMPSSGSVAAGQQATAHPLNADGDVDLAAEREFEVFDEFGVYRAKAYVSGADRGSQGIARWSHAAQKWYIRWLQPHALRISGDAGAAVYYDDTQFTLSGTPVIMNPSGALSMDGDFTGANLAKNPLGLIFGIGDPVHLEWNEAVPQWEAVDKGTYQARWLQFTASADFLTGGAITIDARTYKDGQAPEVDITSILNPDNLTGYNNATGIALIDTNEDPPTYTAVSVSPVAEEVITDFNVDTSTFKLQKKTRDVSVMPRGDESAFVDIHTGDDCEE